MLLLYAIACLALTFYAAFCYGTYMLLFETACSACNGVWSVRVYRANIAVLSLVWPITLWMLARAWTLPFTVGRVVWPSDVAFPPCASADGPIACRTRSKCRL